MATTLSPTRSDATFVLIIPVHNEENALEAFLSLLMRTHPGWSVIAVDDGSCDATPSILRTHRIETLRHEQNQGKGAALLSGLRAAQKKGYSWAITLDGDGQHHPEHIDDFVARSRDSGAQLVLGVRQFRQRGMPWHRQLSNQLTSLLISLGAGQRIHDSQCGYRAYDLSSDVWQSCRERGFQFESEVLLRLGKSGGKMEEIPVSTLYPDDSKSHIRLFQDTFAFLRLLIRSLTW